MECRKEARIGTFETARIRSRRDQFARECVVTDMSRSGARIGVVGAADVPDEVELFVSRLNFWRRARVVWRRQSSCGIEFHAGSDLAQALSGPGS